VKKVHFGMMSRYGLRPALAEVEQLRVDRYTAEYAEMCSKADNGTGFPVYTVGQYFEDHPMPDENQLSMVWLVATAMIDWLLKRMFDVAEVDISVIIDGSVKFCKRLFAIINGEHTRLSNTHVLMIALNEIFQPIHFMFIDAESHDALTPFLQTIIDYNLPKWGDNSTTITTEDEADNADDGYDFADLMREGAEKGDADVFLDEEFGKEDPKLLVSEDPREAVNARFTTHTTASATAVAFPTGKIMAVVSM
jgi:dsDNA-binding SOS-regulon protein